MRKKLLVLLFAVSILSFILIIINLPSNVNITHKVEIKNFLIPREDNQKLIHKPDDDHQIQVPIDQIDELNDVNHEIISSSIIINDHLKRKERVIQMALHGWNGYKKYAWGRNELKPNSKTSHLPGIFGNANNLGATIIDGLDTLYIMNLTDEYNLGREWIKDHFSIKVDTYLSAFETNIRFLGGFLSLYALTNDKLYLEKADEVGEALLPIFDSPSGLPYSLFNPIGKGKKNYNWASGACSILAEVGTLSLEFEYLADLTGKKIYSEKINKIFETLDKLDKTDGLYYNYINPSSGTWCSRQASIGGLADSFYEYLLKLYLYKNKSDKKLLNTYLNAMDSLFKKIITKSPKGLTYAGEYSGSYLSPKMGHLACFSGGLLALTVMNLNDELDKTHKDNYQNLAIELTRTCHESYINTPTHLGPESFTFNSENDVIVQDRYYILRPETIESYFYLWRMTKDEKYRDWAWDALESIEKYCKSENGYSGIKDVSSINPVQDDVQQSFFFAETLKYLYLIFSDDDLLPIDKYVFNTEAHPFLIKTL